MITKVRFYIDHLDWVILDKALIMVGGAEDRYREAEDMVTINFDNESDVPKSMRRYIVHEESKEREIEKGVYHHIVDLVMSEVDKKASNNRDGEQDD